MKDVRHDSNGVPIISWNELETRVEGFLRLLAPECIQTASATPIAEIAKYLRDHHQLNLAIGVDLGHRGVRKIRGSYDLASRTIAIDSSLEPGGPRFNFTLAHEIGHFVMHRHLLDRMREWVRSDRIEDGDRELLLNQLETDNPISWIERQANRFASALLLPRVTLPGFIVAKQKERGIVRNIGRIYLDRQSGNYADFKKILEDVTFTYQVSRAVTRIRLRELNILVEASVKDAFGGRGPEHVAVLARRFMDSWMRDLGNGEKDD